MSQAVNAGHPSHWLTAGLALPKQLRALSGPHTADYSSQPRRSALFIQIALLAY